MEILVLDYTQCRYTFKQYINTKKLYVYMLSFLSPLRNLYSLQKMSENGENLQIFRFSKKILLYQLLINQKQVYKIHYTNHLFKPYHHNIFALFYAYWAWYIKIQNEKYFYLLKLMIFITVNVRSILSQIFLDANQFLPYIRSCIKKKQVWIRLGREISRREPVHLR